MTLCAKTIRVSRATVLPVLLVAMGCQHPPALESDWEPFDDARDLNSRNQARWTINAVLLIDGEIVDFVRGPCQLPRFTEQGIAYRAQEGEETELTLERRRIRGVRIGWAKRRVLWSVHFLLAGAVPGFR